jgi:hypothetical protein
VVRIGPPVESRWPGTNVVERDPVGGRVGHAERALETAGIAFLDGNGVRLRD